MAQQTIVQLVDDLDGTQSDNITTVIFSLDGVVYEIDLTEGNAVNLRELLEEYVARARRTGGRIKRGTSSPRAGSTAKQALAIREWGRENGYKVSDRGRLPGDIIKAFEAAQAETTSKTRKRRRKASTT